MILPTARLAPAALAAVLLVPLAARASGPDANGCAGRSAAPPAFATTDLGCSSGTIDRNDDSGAYKFAYVPPMTCLAPQGAFVVFQLGGPEPVAAPGPGTYKTNSSATAIDATFTYPVVEAAGAVELHTFHLNIACADGDTEGGSMSE